MFTLAFVFVHEESKINYNQPLIYLWEIRDSNGHVLYRHIGKSKNGASRPLNDYRRNVERFFQGQHYRLGNRNGFRDVHKELAAAITNKHNIFLRFLRNVMPDENINDAKREEQRRWVLAVS